MKRYFEIIISLLRMMFLPIYNYLLLFVGVEIYGKENWGEFISISIWVFLITFLAKWSGQNYLIKKLSTNSGAYFNVFATNFIERSILLLPSIFFFLYFPFQTALLATVLTISIFIYNSFEILVVYNQKLRYQFFIEFFSFIILIYAFYINSTFNLNTILLLLSLNYSAKFLMFFYSFKIDLKKTEIRFSFKNLISTTPFFLIGFSGWLASRIDIYIVSICFSKQELAEYQIVTSCFLLIQAIPAYILMPINKHLFRLSAKTLHKIKLKIAIIAFPFVLISSIVIWYITNYYFQINFSTSIYILAALSSIPSFLSFIKVIELYRDNKEKKIMYFCFFIFFINIILMCFLIPSFKILGVVLSVCISQWLYLFLISENTSKFLIKNV
jgi:hypothetical protein